VEEEAPLETQNGQELAHLTTEAPETFSEVVEEEN
jgi:hypothetical protein